METLTEVLCFSMVIIGVGSFIFGILPMVFSFRVARSSPFFLSLILCLGGGVLLATSLVHMLTEVQTKLKLYTQLYFCAGCLTLYTFDEISHYCLGSKNSDIYYSVGCENNRSRRTNSNATRAALRLSENSPFLESNQTKNFETFPRDNHLECSHSHFSEKYGEEERERTESQQSLLDSRRQLHSNDQNQVDGPMGELQSPNTAAKTGLLLALLIHSILEGVSIGVQTKISQILLILGAVTFHKIVVSFCLGLELHYNGFKIFHSLAAIFFFSIGSPVGILLGMTVTSYENGIFGVDDQLQAVAAGSLLYVATFEVLPRERFKWQHRSDRKAAGVLQLLFMLIGFSFITVFHFCVDSVNEGDNKPTVSKLPQVNLVDKIS